MANLTNLVTNPQPKTSDAGWSYSGNGATVTWNRYTSGFGGSADAYVRLGWTTVTGGSDGHIQYAQPVTPGRLFSAAIEVLPSRAQVFTPAVTFVDGTGQLLMSAYETDVAVAAGAVGRLGVGGLTVPAGAVEAWVTAATSLDGGVPWQVGDNLRASRVIVTESLTVRNYFDGSYPKAFWSGAEYASQSTLVAATVPELVPLPDWSPVPRVSVRFTDLHPLAERVTVERVVGGRSARVRGAINQYAVGGFGILDTEAPKSVPITYRAQQFDAAGNDLGYTDPGTVTLEFEGSCIHQPLDPTRNVAYIFSADAVADIVRPFAGEMFYPEGRGTGVWIGGKRAGIVNVNLNGLTETLEDADKLESLFGTPEEPQTPILCIRTAGIDLPPTLFAVVQEPHRLATVGRMVGFSEQIRWGMTGTECAPPAPGLVKPLLTYDDLDAAYATYDERDAHYASYFEQDTDWSLAGLAR